MTGGVRRHRPPGVHAAQVVRVDFDITVTAMALTAREMNARYKETSEGGLAVSVSLC
jgi:hypothetical protein